MSMAVQIEAKLNEALAPTHVDLENESHMHNVPEGSESHWRLLVVSETFEGKRLVQRHQAVYLALNQELAGGIHALTMETLTPAEWSSQGSQAPASPQCLGGSKHDPQMG